MGQVITSKKYECEEGTFEVPENVRNEIYGQSIVKIDSSECDNLVLHLSNGTRLRVKSNEGCGGCANGWFLFDKVITCGTEGNVITRVEVNTTVKENSWSDYEGSYTIYIYSQDKRILETTFSGEDNGYYGVGIELIVEMENNSD